MLVICIRSLMLNTMVAKIWALTNITKRDCYVISTCTMSHQGSIKGGFFSMMSFATPRKTAMKVAILLYVSLLANSIMSLPASADTRIVKGFDIERYLGTWHEIARLPVFYQNGCKNSKAIYKRIDGGNFSINNTCQKGDRLIEIRGTATQAKPGHFKSEFKKFLTFRAEYLVHWVDPKYRTAVVGTPNGKRVWILSRTSKLSPLHQAEALKQLKKFGYADEKLIWN